MSAFVLDKPSRASCRISEKGGALENCRLLRKRLQCELRPQHLKTLLKVGYGPFASIVVMAL